MKIDDNLRKSIAAAARCQQGTDWSQHNKDRQSAAITFLAGNPPLCRKVNAARKKHLSLMAQLSAARKALDALTDPVGITFSNDDTNPTMSRGDDNEEKFTAAGGIIPRENAKWSADRVIARLLAAKPEDRDAILKEYGINWTD